MPPRRPNPIRRRSARWRELLAPVALTACVVFLPGPAAADVIERIVAVVEGKVILMSDVRAVMLFDLVEVGNAPDPERTALEAIIERELILVEARRYILAPPVPEAVAARYEGLRSQFETAQSFESALAVSGLNEAQLREHLRDDLRIESYITQRFGPTAEPTEEEIRAYYREHILEFTRDARQSPLADVREAISDELRERQRRSLIEEWVDELRRRGNVVLPTAPAATSRR